MATQGTEFKQPEENPAYYRTIYFPPEYFQEHDEKKVDYEVGTWADGYCFPAHLREQYRQNGLKIRVPFNSRGNMYRVGANDYFPPEVAAKLTSEYNKWKEMKKAFNKSKAGGKIVAGFYISTAICILLSKYYIINYREFYRQQEKFRMRVQDPSVNWFNVELREAMEAKHKKWLTTYYEEDEEDDE